MMPHLISALLLATFLIGSTATPASAGSVRGTVKFSGPTPDAGRLVMKSDEKCAAKNPDGAPGQWAIVGEAGAVANAFVYVSSGAKPTPGEAPTEPVILANDGCMFTPHVVGIRVGQPLHLKNSDDTDHKVQSLPKQNRRFSATLAAGATPVEKRMEAEEVMIRVKCNEHVWESAYVGVLPHSFFAVTDTSGGYQIDDLPPGAYTITAWHETFGTETAEITVEAEGGPASADFTFEPDPS